MTGLYHESLVTVEAENFFNTFGRENIKNRASMLVCILAYAVKNTVCTRRVKSEQEI